MSSNTEELREQITEAILFGGITGLADLDLHSVPNIDNVMQLITAHEAASVQAARLDELNRNDYLFNKNLGSQHALRERKAELQPKEGDKTE